MVYAVALSLVAPSALAVEYVNDPLTSDSFPGRGSKGGTFSGSGWTTTAEPDAVWYEIPDALPQGKIEYTVTGISMDTMDSEHPGTLLMVRDAVQELLDAGRIHPYVGERFPLGRSAEALRLIEDGRALGKVIVEIPR